MDRPEEPFALRLLRHCLTSKRRFGTGVGLDFNETSWYDLIVPERGTPRETKRPWHLARGLALVFRKENIMPMKKPIRLLGMVFQIDK